MSLLSMLQKRRSIYTIGKNSPLHEEEITAIVEQIVQYCPSAFNSQSSRVVLLFKEQHQKLWQITLNRLEKIISPTAFEKTAAKIKSFANGFATILYFEEQETIANLQKKFPLYQENFSIWSEQANGMLQFAVWTALAEKDIGASLQHYNPLIDEDVHQEWHLPSSWKLIAQMPLGSIEEAPTPKDFLPISKRIKIFY